VVILDIADYIHFTFAAALNLCRLAPSCNRHRGICRDKGKRDRNIAPS
jgi:hypothetical protein